MPTTLAVFTNVLIYFTVVAATNILRPGSSGKNITMFIGGILLSLLFVITEYAVKFFKFPVNFWSLSLVGFIFNMILFLLLAAGIFPGLAIIQTGNLFGEQGTLAVDILIESPFLGAIALAVLVTLLQMIYRRISK